jgi:polyhydroxyalkanoate synthesis repressor PhaR
MAKQKNNVVLVKKYANRRLYNTQTSCYITLEDLCDMIKRKEDFIVQDAKTSEDITHSILTQIIMEQESKGANLLPANFLRQLISMYDDNLAKVVPHYLENALDHFLQNQESVRKTVESNFSTNAPQIKFFEEVAQKNMDLFSQTMRLFDPFNVMGKPDDKDQK